MRALLQRLSGLDAVAESAVRVIELFDKLAQVRGLADLVRSAAMFSECTVGVADAAGTAVVRMTADGRRLEAHRPDDAAAHPVDGGGEVWLEREGPPLALDGLVLERFAAAVAIARRRERAVAPRTGDHAPVEMLIRRSADESDRMRAIELLGLVPTSPIRMLAVTGRASDVLARCPRPLGKAAVGEVTAIMVHGDENLHARLPSDAEGVRVGVGPCAPALEARRSWRAARLAARFAGGPSAPAAAGDPAIVYWDDLGGLAAIAEYVPRDAISEIPDVAALDRLAAERTGAMTLAVLRALCEAESIRLAARSLHMHHSSVGQRLDHAEQVLGFPVRASVGRHRLALALTLRRLRDSGDERRRESGSERVAHLEGARSLSVLGPSNQPG
jgi:hypothetical protein